MPSTEPNPIIIKKMKLGALIIAIVIFGASLTQPAYYTSAQEPDGWANSLGLLLIGWVGALGGHAGLAWLANPAILTAWISVFKNIKTSVIASILAACFSASFLVFSTVITDENGTCSMITDRKMGYWLWLTSIIFFAVSSIVIYIFEKSSNIKTNTTTNI